MKVKESIFICLVFTSLVLQNCNFDKTPVASDFNSISEKTSNTFDADLVFGFNFDEISGTTVYNSSSNGIHGEILGATRVSGISNSAIRFNDLRSRIEIKMPWLDNEPGTISVPFEQSHISIFAWIKLDKEQQFETQHVIGNGYFGLKSFRVQIENRKVQFLIDDNPEWINIISSSTSIKFEEWQNIGITYDGSIAKIFINGKEDNSENIIFPIPTNYNTIYIGSTVIGFDSGNIFGNQFIGALDEIMIYKKILNVSEIQKNYNDFKSDIYSINESTY